MTQAVYLDYEPRGAARELFDRREKEVLYVGPANCGKTLALTNYAYWLCETFPGVRILWARDTYKSLSESVLVTWEQEVLPGGRMHACVTSSGRASRERRTHYVWPYAQNVVQGKVYEGSSEIILTGLSDPEDWYSTAFDVVMFFEARQVPFKVYQKFLRCLRHKKMPWQQMICDTNPATSRHWLLERAKEGLMYWLRAQHSDNPTFTPDDLETLERLRGSDRAQLLEGRWSDDEGMVWPQFEHSTHVIRAKLERRNEWWYVVPEYIGQACGDDPIRINWVVVGVDWGFRNPGSMSVYGLDSDHRIYRLAQYYRREKNIDWWASKAEELYFEFNVHRFVCDHDPGKIQQLNDRISPQGGRKATRIAIQAEKDVDAYIQLVRDLLAPDKSGKPAIFFVADTLREKERSLEEERLPCCTEDEIPGYVFPAKTDLDAIRERPDPLCPDHGCNELAYVCWFVWGKDRTPKPPKPEYAPGTYGHAYGDLDNPKRGFDHLRREGLL